LGKVILTLPFDTEEEAKLYLVMKLFEEGKISRDKLLLLPAILKEPS